MENKFQAINNETMYNLRQSNSARKLSDCIQLEQSKLVLAIPINNSIMEIFQKNLNRWF